MRIDQLVAVIVFVVLSSCQVSSFCKKKYLRLDNITATEISVVATTDMEPTRDQAFRDVRVSNIPVQIKENDTLGISEKSDTLYLEAKSQATNTNSLNFGRKCNFQAKSGNEYFQIDVEPSEEGLNFWKVIAIALIALAAAILAAALLLDLWWIVVFVYVFSVGAAILWNLQTKSGLEQGEAKPGNWLLNLILRSWLFGIISIAGGLLLAGIIYIFTF